MASTTDAVAGASTAPATTPDASAPAAASENKPVEMSHLNTAIPETPLEETFHDAIQTPAAESVASPLASAPPPSSTQPAATASEQQQQQQPESSSTAPHETLTRKETEHLGPATDAPILAPTNTTSSGPVLSISLMLTTGARHPYKIDEKYLRNRKVEAKNSGTGEFEPRELSGYQLKELIWTDWRSEWEPRPASPSSIRLIVMGRMIEDKMMLKEFSFNLAQTNVVHMTVKPADLIDDDETAAKSGKGGALRARDGEDRGAGCRCVIL